MRFRSRPGRRRGALVVESALVYPLLVLLLLGLIVGGLGVFRYQQVACQAREAARWAAVRGLEMKKESGQAPPTRQEIIRQAVLPLAAGMDPAKLTVQVEWIDQVTGQAHDWDAVNKAVTGMTAAGDPVTHRVRVTVTYRWSPELFLAGPLNLKSVSEMPIAY